ncbi:MAG: hypothetical protein HQL31_01255 [Planctomycetes bacterium]|nr:hypothetical protein [Planctomycetota bacterium]
MGNLMRRNILTYKAPPLNEGYDLICIHPDHKIQKTCNFVRIQVKSRYATDCDRGFPVKEKSIDAFDYLIIVFLNIGNFFRGRDGSEGIDEVEFYTLPRDFIKCHHDALSSWQKVRLKGFDEEIRSYKNEEGFELIADSLNISKPTRTS